MIKIGTDRSTASGRLRSCPRFPNKCCSHDPILSSKLQTKVLRVAQRKICVRQRLTDLRGQSTAKLCLTACWSLTSRAIAQPCAMSFRNRQQPMFLYTIIVVRYLTCLSSSSSSSSSSDLVEARRGPSLNALRERSSPRSRWKSWFQELSHINRDEQCIPAYWRWFICGLCSAILTADIGSCSFAPAWLATRLTLYF